MDRTYYETLRALEEQGVDNDYISGWIGGYLRHPKREEQRLTSRYEAGYADGLEGRTESATTS